MRTVYLPTANSDSLMLRIESLQAQLNEQVNFCGASLESASWCRQVPASLLCRPGSGLFRVVTACCHGQAFPLTDV